MTGEDGDDPPVVVRLREHVQTPPRHHYKTKHNNIKENPGHTWYFGTNSDTTSFGKL